MGGQLLYNRRIRLSIGDNSQPDNAIIIGQDGADFRVDFIVKKSRDSTINSAIIDVYNLSKDMRSRAEDEWNRVTLVAGYDGDDVDDNQQGGFWGIIFDGWTKKITHNRQSSVDIITRFECFDGGRSYSNSPLRKTWAGGTTYRQIVSEIVENMGTITLGDISGIPVDAKVISGRSFAATTTCNKVLDDICRTHHCRWNVDNNVLEIIANNSAVRNGYTVPLISSDTGMIGSPTITEKGIQVTALLHPHVKINRYIYVKDEFIGTGRKGKKTLAEVQADTKKKQEDRQQDGVGISPETETAIKGQVREQGHGIYRVNRITYNGSNFSNEFFIDIEGQRSDGFQVYKGKIDVLPTGYIGNAEDA